MPAPRAVACLLAFILVSLAVLTANVSPGLAATPGWPVANGPLLAEVVTGGVSASDEYVEIANAGPAVVDLSGFELVYVTASGATTTRKATLASPCALGPGAHLLLANAAGSYAPIADVTYAGGLSADGASLVLRTGAGVVVDAVGWGTATNGFVEGTAAPAPPAGSSIERRPGGTLGNSIDANDNAADWLVQRSPLPQPLGSAPAPTPTPTQDATPSEATSPTPEPTSTPTATPTAEATPSPVPTASPAPDATPTPSPTVTPTPTVAPTVTPAPTATTAGTATPTATPTPTALPTFPPTAEPTALPTPAPVSTPTPTATATVLPTSTVTPASAVAIADARRLALGSAVTVEGVLTARLGVLEGGRAGFVQDATGAIGFWLVAAPAEPLPAGTVVRVSGSLDERYGQLVERVDESGLETGGTAPLPAPIEIATNGASEDLEALLVGASGTVTAAPDALADGVGLWLDDGTGPLRVVVTPAVAAGLDLRRGLIVRVTGPLGQHASGDSPGYRVMVTEPGSVSVFGGPSPAPTGSPSASGTPSPSLSPAPTPSPAASPSASPTAGASPAESIISIADARARPTGSHVRVGGVVTLPAGSSGNALLAAIQDQSGGIFVRLSGDPDELWPGRIVEVAGTLAAPYGQLEIRTLDRVVLGGAGTPLAPFATSPSAVGEALEARLVTLEGSVTESEADGDGRVSIALADTSGWLRVFAVADTGLLRADAPRGATIRVSGVVGQRATGNGRENGYRVWLRGRDDLEVVGGGSGASASPGKTTKPSASGTPAPLRDLRTALAAPGSVAEVDVTVTAPVGLFECGGPTLVVEDSTAAVAVLVPDGAPRLSVGARVRLDGKVGSWRGAPRLVAASVEPLGEAVPKVARTVSGAVGSQLEWRLVRVSGRIDKVTRIGARWSASVLVGGQHVAVLGEPGAGIEASSLARGRLAVFTGVVRRGSDKTTFRLVPRSATDVKVGPAPAAPASGQGSHASGLLAAPSPGIEVADLERHVGQTVTVSGLVVEAERDAVALDDGTGSVRLAAGEPDDPVLDLVEPGDAIEVTGRVARAAAGLELRIASDGIVALTGGYTGDAPGIGSGGPSPMAVGVGAEGSAEGGPGGSVAAGSGAALRPAVPAGPGLLQWLAVGLLGAAALLLVAIRGALALRRRRYGTAGSGDAGAPASGADPDGSAVGEAAQNLETPFGGLASPFEAPRG